MAFEIPNANPVKFWLNGEEVFNDKTETGIQFKEFKQAIQLDDQIRLQFFNSQLIDYRLKIVDLDTGDQIGNHVNSDKNQMVDNTWKYTFEFSMLAVGVPDKTTVKIYLVSVVNNINAASTDSGESSSADLTNTGLSLGMFTIDAASTDSSETSAANVRTDYDVVLTIANVTASGAGITVDFTNDLAETEELTSSIASGSEVKASALKAYGDVEVSVSQNAVPVSPNYTVRWVLNGVEVHTDSIAKLQTKSYTFIGVKAGDQLLVDLYND